MPGNEVEHLNRELSEGSHCACVEIIGGEVLCRGKHRCMFYGICAAESRPPALCLSDVGHRCAKIGLDKTL